MPFDELETITKANEPPTASLSYTRHHRKGQLPKEGTRPKLIVTVPAVIMISQAKLFRLFVGTGEDEGKLRLCGVPPGTKGAVKGTDFKSFVVIRFGYVPRFGDEIFDGVRCEVVRVTDDSYDLLVPAAILPPPPKPETEDKPLPSLTAMRVANADRDRRRKAG